MPAAGRLVPRESFKGLEPLPFALQADATKPPGNDQASHAWALMK